MVFNCNIITVCYHHLPRGVVDVDGEVAVVTIVVLVDPSGLEVPVSDGWVVEGGSE